MTTETVDTTERTRPAMVILKELARQQPDLLRSVVKHVIAELAMAGEMSRLGAFARLAKELFLAPPERKAIPADGPQPSKDTVAATGKKQLELPTAKPAAKVEEEEEVEDEDVEEEEEEEEETPGPAFTPVAKASSGFSLGGAGKKKAGGKGKK